MPDSAGSINRYWLSIPDQARLILAAIDRGSCQPAIVRLGGEEAAWRKVKSLNWELYRSACVARV
jgi:hypothetical protein